MWREFRMNCWAIALLAGCGFSSCQTAAAADPFENFITAKQGGLFDGTQPFRFISWNVPNLLLIEDRLSFDETNDWSLPDRFEITDALSTVSQMGGNVARTYAISVTRDENPPPRYSHVRGVGNFNEDAFRTLDLALQVAHEQGVRLIIPLVNHWPWFGGRREYAAFRGKTADAFWTDPQLIADFEQTLEFVLTRTNTLTGVCYRDDKAILCWETGNEVRCPSTWTQTIARYIKSLDTNHLVMDGSDEQVHLAVLAMPEIDIVTRHYYPDSNSTQSFAEKIRGDDALIARRKVFIVGEFGFADTKEMTAAMSAIADGTAAGGMLWSLRFHSRDGGFYWHSESSGGPAFKAFHWPGSDLGAAYDEINLMRIVREKAFGIRGMSVPALPIPPAPKLLPIQSAPAISWQGSVGAKSYQVERSPKPTGPWQIVSTNVDEAYAQYHPQFADETAPVGKWYYRVLARNDSGLSEPSNVVGPVKVSDSFLVDELTDFSRVQARNGEWKIAATDCRPLKEDARRAAGTANSTLVYKIAGELESFGVFAFFPKSAGDVKFFLSDDGVAYRPVKAQAKTHPQPAGDYGYWSETFFHAESLKGGAYLKLQLTGDTEIGRVEIAYHSNGQ